MRLVPAEDNQPETARGGRRKRLAVAATKWSYLSHAQHITDRFLLGYPHEGRWHRPALDVVSLYVDQIPANDQSASRAEQFGFRVYPTIAETLRCGGPNLDVDAVLIIAEHGNYPKNEKGQILYPRFEFFEQVVDVFQSDGRSVPVFNDKHLSYSMTKARKMVAASKRLKFPLLAGSSLPVTWRMPDLELPLDCDIDDALMVGVGSSDSSDYHALEALQCMVERRRAGETGIKSVQLIEGDAVWQAGKEGLWSLKLLEAALSRSDLILGQTLVDSRPQDLVGSGELPKLVTHPAAYLIDRNDGLRTTLLMLNGAVGDYTFAARLKGNPEIVSTQFYLPPKPNVAYSACLVSKIEEMIETRRAPYPVERTLLVSGMLESCLDSKYSGHRLLNTPHLNVRYKAPAESHYCRT
jgi:hypothetical protein